MIAPALDQVRTCISETIGTAGLSPRDVDLVIRTGGSSLLPAFNVMLDELFGATRVETRPPFSRVAGGLAELAERSSP